MIAIVLSGSFDHWLSRLKDQSARARVLTRIDRMAGGNLGDVKSVGSGVSEARIDVGPGYRLYFMQRGPVVIVLLAGGDKSTQAKDIAKAKAIATEWERPS